MGLRFFIVLILALISIYSCNHQSKSKAMNIERFEFDLQGHRGARGILPENSIEAFQQAMNLGVNTLELDVVLSKDSLVVVSHEAYMNPDICLRPDGTRISDKESYNLYRMNYDEIKKFDCGSLKHPDFPEQKSVKTYKPLLSEVIQMTTKNLREKGFRPVLNIELKSDPETDNIYHPEPKAFVDLVVKTIKSELIPTYMIVLQSFDERVVRYVIDQYPEFKVAYLVESGSFYDNLEKLGKTPQIYSPLYTLLDSIQVKQAHDSGLKVIPWTVNEVSEMRELLKMGVDGIITDYPNKAKPLHKS
jgi:glycerophosphoryl diester phosphodiesterase